MKPSDVGCDCANCPFATKEKTHQQRFVSADGPSKPLGVVIADIPTRDDVGGGVPLRGPVGQEFDKTLEAAALHRDQLLLVPVTACQQPEPRKDRDIPKAVAACKPWRDHWLKGHENAPKLILGQWAYYGVTGLSKGFGAHRGFVDYETKTVVTWRPELAYFWNPYEWATFDIDVERFARAIRGRLAPVPIAITSDVDMAAIHVRAAKEGWVAYDIETAPAHPEAPWTGKDPTQAKLRTLGFGWEDVGHSFFWQEADISVKVAAIRLLQDPRVTKVGINVIYFDNPVLARNGVVVAPFFDIRDARRALSSTSKLSLAYQSTLYTDVHPWKQEKSDEEEDSQK
jgi:uracil-DNA glycosylase family 4